MPLRIHLESNNMAEQPTFDEICDFFARYQAIFEQLDPQAIAAFWFEPTLALETNQIRVCLNEQALLAAFKGAVGDLTAVGMCTASFALEEVRVLRDDLVDCVVHWQLRDATGRLLKKLHNIYVLRRDEHSWGIAAVYLLPANRPVTHLVQQKLEAVTTTSSREV